MGGARFVAHPANINAIGTLILVVILEDSIAHLLAATLPQAPNIFAKKYVSTTQTQTTLILAAISVGIPDVQIEWAGGRAVQLSLSSKALIGTKEASPAGRK